MVDEIKSNLEPIEESDLNLKEKFTGGGIKKETFAPLSAKEIKPLPAIEKIPAEEERAPEKEETYAKILSKIPAVAPAATTSDDDIKNDAQAANAEIDIESKITNLVQLAEAKGIPHAVKVARHMEDNYALDELHDRMLGEEFHNALVQKGMIKEF